MHHRIGPRLMQVKAVRAAARDAGTRIPRPTTMPATTTDDHHDAPARFPEADEPCRHDGAAGAASDYEAIPAEALASLGGSTC